MIKSRSIERSTLKSKLQGALIRPSLALTALMDNDRDRYNTYMAAYNARVAHIKNSQTALTRNALKGGGSLSLPSF